ncbi:MAG TPA: phosphoribosylformylglycinamidine synthase II, partial [Brevundimonas sp.]
AHAFLFGEDQARYLVAVSDADALIAKAQDAGLHASVVGLVKGTDFASSGPKGELFRIPVAHVREFHEGWMPNWIEG